MVSYERDIYILSQLSVEDVKLLQCKSHVDKSKVSSQLGMKIALI